MMVKHCIACGSGIYRREPLYIYDALQLRWAVIGVEDARIPTAYGNEYMLVDAAKQGWKQGWNGGNGIAILQYTPPA